MAAGRACPLGYRMGAARLRRPNVAPRMRCDTLFVVGGLYGNLQALRAVQRRADREPQTAVTRVVLNGDFNFFNAEQAWWTELNNAIRDDERLVATLGNVEIEAASATESDAGCGCAYPNYVGDDVVDRSNEIVNRLRAVAHDAPGAPSILQWLRDLPMARIVEVGPEARRVAVIHGDPCAARPGR